MGVGVQTYNINLPFLNAQVARGYVAFFAGILLADFLDRKKINIKMGLVCAIVVTILSRLIYTQSPIISDGFSYLLVFCYFPAIIIIAKIPFIKKMFNYKWIGVLGKITFDVYIIHNPLYVLMYIFIKIFNLNINLNSEVTMMLYTVICFATGTIIHFLYEEPINKYINRVCVKK